MAEASRASFDSKRAIFAALHSLSACRQRTLLVSYNDFCWVIAGITLRSADKYQVELLPFNGFYLIHISVVYLCPLQLWGFKERRKTSLEIFERVTERHRGKATLEVKQINSEMGNLRDSNRAVMSETQLYDARVRLLFLMACCRKVGKIPG